MQKRNLKFALLLKNGRPVRSLEELKAHYDIERIISYYNNGQLERWLEQNDYMKQLNSVKQLKNELNNKLKNTLESILLKDENKEKQIEAIQREKSRKLSEIKNKEEKNRKIEEKEEKEEITIIKANEEKIKKKEDFKEGLNLNKKGKDDFLQNKRDYTKTINHEETILKINGKSKIYKSDTGRKRKLEDIEDIQSGEKNTNRGVKHSAGQYTEEDIMINRQKMLNTRKGIVTGLKKNVEVFQENSVNISRIDYKKDNVDNKTQKKDEDLSCLKDNHGMDDEISKYRKMELDTKVGLDAYDIVQNNVDDDEEFKRMSEIIKDPKSLQMLREFYIKNKKNKLNENSPKDISSFRENQEQKEEKINNKQQNDNRDIKQYNLNGINTDTEENYITSSKFTVYSQEDYIDIIKRRKNKDEHLDIYVSFEGLIIDSSNKNIKYIGINNPIIILKGDSYFDAIKNEISFLNFKISANRQIGFICNQMDGCSIDRSTIKKGMQDLIVKYPGMMNREYLCHCLNQAEVRKTFKESSLEEFIDNLFLEGKNQIELLATAKYEGLEIYTNVFMGMVDMAFLRDEEGKIHDISKIFLNMESIDIFRKDPDIGIEFVALLKKNDLKRIEIMKNKKYKRTIDALVDILTGQDAEEFLQYVMLMPVKIFNAQNKLNRIDQIKLIELMNLDTGVSYISKRLVGTSKQLKEEVCEFIEKVSSSREISGTIFDGIKVEYISDNDNETLQEAIFKFKGQTFNTRITDIKFLLDKDRKLNAYIGIEGLIIKNNDVKVIKLQDADLFTKLALNVNDNIIVSFNDDNCIINKDLDNATFNNVHVPLICPYCGENLSFREMNSFGICENSKCQGAIVSSIYTQLLDLKVYDVDFEVIAHAHKNGFINELSDFIRLSCDNLSKILKLSSEKTIEIQGIIKKRIYTLNNI